MPFEYKKKQELSPSELYSKANTEKQGTPVPPESRVSLSQAYAASTKQEQETPLKAIAAQSIQAHPFIVPAEMLPPGSKFRPAKEPLINPPKE